eukprot:SAG22_NODE_732_length_7583_cov_3.250134_5_plen_136_part_00
MKPHWCAASPQTKTKKGTRNLIPNGSPNVFRARSEPTNTTAVPISTQSQVRIRNRVFQIAGTPWRTTPSMMSIAATVPRMKISDSASVATDVRARPMHKKKAIVVMSARSSQPGTLFGQLHQPRRGPEDPRPAAM